MGKAEKRKNRIGPKTATNAIKMANELASQAYQDPLAENMHDYLSQDTEFVEIEMCEEEFLFLLPPLPETPCKLPAAKQCKTEGGDTSDILSQLGERLKLINNRSDSLEKMVGENSRGIASMKESINENTKQISGIKDVIDFMSADVKDLKVKLGVTESLAKITEFNFASTGGATSSPRGLLSSMES